MKKNILKIVILVIVDQVIKIIISNTIGVSGNSITLIPHVLKLTYLENTGAAFGMFSGRILLIGVDLLIIFFVLKLLLDKKSELIKGNKVGLTFILAGGIGNLIDRIFRGSVVDYLDITDLFDYPIFNFADICVVVGVILIIIVILISTVQRQEREK